MTIAPCKRIAIAGRKYFLAIGKCRDYTRAMTTFREYYDSLSVAQRAEIAKRADTQPIYLYQIAAGLRRPSPDMAKRLHQATGFAVSLHALRPDVWDAA